MMDDTTYWSIFIILCIAVSGVVGCSCNYMDKVTLRKEAIKRGHAEYHGENNIWRWKEVTK